MATRTFKTKSFARFCRGAKIDDQTLREAADRAERGIIDADLGGGVIKQRVARPGQGRPAGFRTLIIYRQGDRAIFVHGFAKSKKDNIDCDDLETLRALAEEFLNYSDNDVEALVKSGGWIEV